MRLAAILARCNVVVILISSFSVTGCPKDWVEEGSNCYRAIPDLQKAIDARNECKKLGADLPVIKSTEENTFFLKLTEDRGETWLGMYAEMNNDFHWVDGTSVADTFSAWAPGEPNYPADEHCAYTAISRKVVGKTVHATISKGNMGYDQYTVPDTVAVEPTFIAFL